MLIADAASHVHAADYQFDDWMTRIQAQFTRHASQPLFLVNTPEPLFDIYLSCLPAHERQYHNCWACKHFINKFGRLATIQDAQLVPVMWGADAPPFYAASDASMADAIRHGSVVGVFHAEEGTWGTPRTGEWTHFGVVPPAAIVHTDRHRTAAQRMAEKFQDFLTVKRAVAEVPRVQLRRALELVQTNQLYRGEKVVGAMTWLRDLCDMASPKRGRARDLTIWPMVASAPPGFCHPRASVWWSLIEDLDSGKSADAAIKAFDAKMDPTKYQRPTAAPKAGAIDAAERLFEQMGASRSLERRLATLSDLTLLWAPTPEKAAGGTFGRLRQDTQRSDTTKEQKITWVKFAATVLPIARQIEVYAPALGNYCQYVTAVHEDAPPILQWDEPHARNPVNLYVYTGGSSCANWGVGTGWNTVVGLTLRPHQWRDENAYPHQGKDVAFLFGGNVWDRRAGHLALFPEILRSEFHPVRSVIERFALTGKLAGSGQPSAVGLLLGSAGVKVRVSSASTRAVYHIERWD